MPLRIVRKSLTFPGVQRSFMVVDGAVSSAAERLFATQTKTGTLRRVSSIRTRLKNLFEPNKKRHTTLKQRNGESDTPRRKCAPRLKRLPMGTMTREALPVKFWTALGNPNPTAAQCPLRNRCNRPSESANPCARGCAPDREPALSLPADRRRSAGNRETSAL